MSVVLLLAALPSLAQAEGPQALFYRLPYFAADDTAACRSDVLAYFQTQPQVKKLSAAEWEKFSEAFYRQLEARDVLRPLVDGRQVLIGTNIRWLSVAPACHNVLLSCDANRPDSCAEIASLPNEQVLTPIYSDQENIVAGRETFAGDVLNIANTDFVISNDHGKSWSDIALPLPCNSRGVSCRLIAQSALHYTLISTTLNPDGAIRPFQDVSLHSTHDGGKSWTTVVQQWRGIQIPEAVFVKDDVAIAVPEADGEFLTISRLDFATGDQETLATQIPAAQWDTRNYRFVADFKDSYLVQVEARESARFGKIGVFVVAKDTAAPSSKLVWQSDGASITSVYSSATAIVIHSATIDTKRSARARLSEKLLYSLDGGANWKQFAMPESLLGSMLQLIDNKLWLFSPAAVNTLDLATLNPD